MFFLIIILTANRSTHPAFTKEIPTTVIPRPHQHRKLKPYAMLIKPGKITRPRPPTTLLSTVHPIGDLDGTSTGIISGEHTGPDRPTTYHPFTNKDIATLHLHKNKTETKLDAPSHLEMHEKALREYTNAHDAQVIE